MSRSHKPVVCFIYNSFTFTYLTDAFIQLTLTQNVYEHLGVFRNDPSIDESTEIVDQNHGANATVLY